MTVETCSNKAAVRHVSGLGVRNGRPGAQRRIFASIVDPKLTLQLPSALSTRRAAGMARGLAALARRAAQARQVMAVRGGGGGPLGKPLPPSQALMEEDEL